MNSLLKMLPLMIRLSGDNEEVREQAVFAAWRATAGEKIAYNCIPAQLDQKHLIIAVLDQAWKKQMEKVSGEYLFRINSLLGAPIVTYIEFRIDRKHVQKSRPAETKGIEFHHLEELEAEMKAAAESIKDDELREQFLRTAAKSLERRGS
jgi:hypothetical protein